jgi:hypothetical protein
MPLIFNGYFSVYTKSVETLEHCCGENRAVVSGPGDSHLAFEYAEDSARGFSLPIDSAAVSNGHDPSRWTVT